VALGYPVGWLLCSVIIFTYYKCGRWEKKKIASGEEIYADSIS